MLTFLPNARVALHGLNAGHVYNGRFGIVLEGPDPTTTRYKVCMDVEIGLNKYLNVTYTYTYIHVCTIDHTCTTF